MTIINHIRNKEYDLAKDQLLENIQQIVERKLEQKKRMIAAKDMCDCGCGGYKICMVSGDPKDDFVSSPSVEKAKKGLTMGEEKGLWDNIHAKRERIKHGSGERMRKPGSKGAPSDEDLKNSQNEEKLAGNSGDRTGKTCEKCHKGKYQETSQHDDMYGVLHCTKCGTQVKRWKSIKEENVSEEELDEARIKIVKARIRAGKVQRRKRVSNVPGYTMRGGQLKKMSPMERRKRRLGQRRGKIKRRAKLQRALIKRQRSLRKRTALGLPQ